MVDIEKKTVGLYQSTNAKLTIFALFENIWIMHRVDYCIGKFIGVNSGMWCKITLFSRPRRGGEGRRRECNGA